tara:strand:+ start:640 stop:783 length:144 start_codon:yes stop_codon:yes gene_type:complete
MGVTVVATVSLCLDKIEGAADGQLPVREVQAQGNLQCYRNDAVTGLE